MDVRRDCRPGGDEGPVATVQVDDLDLLGWTSRASGVSLMSRYRAHPDSGRPLMRLGKLLSVGEAIDREPAAEAETQPDVTVPVVTEAPAPVSAGR